MRSFYTKNSSVQTTRCYIYQADKSIQNCISVLQYTFIYFAILISLIQEQQALSMNQYTLQTKLGEGAFSVVYKVNRKEDGLDYAMKKMKIMNFSEKELANCLNEVRILASIEDPQVVSYKDSFYDELTKTFCIVTQFLEGGDLAHLIHRNKNAKKAVSEKMIWEVAYQVLKGLETLHNNKILHRDIKSANIFMAKDHKSIKLGDMNVSTVSNNGMARTQTGTPYYASPEVWNQKPYSAKCDIWSLGCVLYEMATFRPPFVSNDMRSLKKCIIAGIVKKIPNYYSSELESFIRKCLRVDAKDRPSADQLLKDIHFNSMQDENSMRASCKLIDKIQPPRKRDFRIIKDRLPRNKFSSVERTIDNSSLFLEKEKNKQNILNINENHEMSSKILRKQNLPSLRPISASNKAASCQKIMVKERPSNNQVRIIEPIERPPLPKHRALRG